MRSWKYLKLPAGLDQHILDVLVLYIHYIILMMMMMMTRRRRRRSYNGCLSMSYYAMCGHRRNLTKIHLIEAPEVLYQRRLPESYPLGNGDISHQTGSSENH